MPIKLAGRILVYGQNFQFQYPLPQNATFFSNLSQNRVFSRRRRDLDWYGRDLFFNTLEQNFQRYSMSSLKSRTTFFFDETILILQKRIGRTRMFKKKYLRGCCGPSDRRRTYRRTSTSFINVI